MAEDRLPLLQADDGTLVGIDFIRVDTSTQQALWVFFLGSDTAVSDASTADAFTAAGDITIESTSPDSSVPSVEVTDLWWELVSGRPALRVETASPGDFSIYKLSLPDDPSRVDPYFGSVEFTFKAGCESRLDCQARETVCPDEELVDVPVDYQARDWRSYRRALLEMVTLRHPHWKDRLEADLGMMMLESMAALADEMTYTQDRFAREAHLATATQRRSVRRHARFVDYEMHDGLTASGWLLVEVTGGAGTVSIPAGTTAQATGDDGKPIIFEVGTSIDDMVDRRAGPGNPYVVDAALDGLAPYIWDEDDTCLPSGSTSLDLEGWVKAALDALPAYPRRLLLRAVPIDAALPVRTAWVVLDSPDQVVQATDPLTGTDYTRLTWSEAWATPSDMDLEVLRVHGNLVPIVAGQTMPGWSENPGSFTIRPEDDAWSGDVPHAVERTGPGGAAVFLHGLGGSDETPLSWVPEDDTAIGAAADTGTLALDQKPEIWLQEVDPAGGSGDTWDWQRSLLGSPSATSSDKHFTLDDGLWEEVVRYWRDDPDPIRHYDYRTGDGYSIRFGDGDFGMSPPRGTVFALRYRLGGGERGNLPVGRAFELAVPGVAAATNPIALINGLESEALEDVRRLAPEAWRAVAFRAVTEEDYEEALERLPEVDRAGAEVRWTGSWHTVFATPDPAGRITLDEATRDAVAAQLERFRLAGREAHVQNPVYAWLDLKLTICVSPSRYRGQVEAEIRDALVGPYGASGFFAPDRWTFGDILYRSALEEAIHAVPGVEAVRTVEVRRRGFFDWQPLDPQGLEVESNAVIGVGNDPLHPERGSLEFVMEGGA